MSPSTATVRRPCRALDEVLERGAHRDRVRVVASLISRPPPGSGDLLPRQRENSTSSAPSATSRPSACAATQRRERVLGLVARREARRRARDRRRSPTRRRRALASTLRRSARTSMSSRVEVRLEQRLVGHDRRPARRQRLDQLAPSPRDALERADQLEVDRADVRDHADVRPRERRRARRSGRGRASPARAMQTSVSGSSRQSVSGTPISLL